MLLDGSGYPTHTVCREGPTDPESSGVPLLRQLSAVKSRVLCSTAVSHSARNVTFLRYVVNDRRLMMILDAILDFVTKRGLVPLPFTKKAIPRITQNPITSTPILVRRNNLIK